MRLILAALALLLCASVADAAPKFVGAWVLPSAADDYAGYLTLDVASREAVSWASSIDTSYDAYLYIAKSGASSLWLILTGTWSDVSANRARFAVGEADSLAVSTTWQDWEAYMVLTNGTSVSYMGDTDSGDPFWLRTRCWATYTPVARGWGNNWDGRWGG